MKSIYTAILVSCCIGISNCQEISEFGYQLKTTILDDLDKPVESASVIGARQELRADSPIALSKSLRVEALSGSDGIALLKFNSLPTPGGIAIHKQGFYSSFYSVNWSSVGSIESKTYHAEIKALLKPVKNPIAMFARSFGNTRIKIPQIGLDYKYDLEICEFLPPHGNGKHDDVIFHVTGSNDSKGKGQIQMTVRGNGDQTGFASFSTENRERGSILISDYLAPEKDYANSLTFKFDSSDMRAAMNQPNNQNYYFRVRCQLNPDGTIKSCHYGKLYGPFTFWNIPIVQGGVASFGIHTSYFNPTPNDRNVEFDMKRNLLPGGNVQRP